MNKVAPQTRLENKGKLSNHPRVEAMTVSSFDTLPTVTGPSQVDLNPRNILALQRTIGNQAVQRLIKQNQANSTSPAVQRLPSQARPATVGPVIQRMPSYNSFQRGWQRKAPGQDISVFSSDPVDSVHSKPLPGSGRHFKVDQANILVAYQRYEQERTAEALSELFHSINYWEALSTHSAAEKWYKPARDYVGELKNQIKIKIQKKTDKQHGTKIIKAKNPFQQVPWSRSNHTAKIKGAVAQKFIPDFLKEVGVSSEYYTKHLAGHKDRIGALREFYNALEAGDTGKAADAYAKVSDVPGMYLIKPLFIRHLAGNANMGKLFGTDGQTNLGQGLSKEEIAAIREYTSDSFIPMNNQLRTAGETKRVEYPTNVDDRWEPNLDGFGKKVKQQRVLDKRQNTMELAVSGMNKLPKFNGVAYRGLKTVPDSYFDVVRPGAMLVDLAFQSASPSLEGARFYLKNNSGTKEVYFMVHTRTAVNIVAQSGIPKEAEVLFRPGVRFQVKSIWQYVKGKVPKNAPAEAQMMLHSLGEERSEVEGIDSMTGKSPAEYKEELRKRMILHENPTEGLDKLKWNKVKVIELVEV